MTPEIKVEKITQEEFDKKEAGRRVSHWNEILARVEKTKQPIKVSNLTRGQVASGYRKAKDLNIKVKADYKNGVLYFSA